MNKNQNTLMIIVAVVVVVAGGLLFVKMRNDAATKNATESMEKSDSMMADNGADKSGTADTDDSQMMGDDKMMKDEDVKTISIEAGSFYYKPAVITVKKGETVKLVMTSKDMMHDFNIDELGIKLPLTKSGETNSVEFTPTKTGTFEYYCSVGQHRKNGQVGKITVE